MDKPGILTDDASQVTIVGGAPEITGDPPVQQDPTISDETFTEFGDLEWDELTAMANITLSGGNINTMGSRQHRGRCLP